MRGQEAPARQDFELMLAFQRGEQECFEQLFQKYKAPIINFAFRFTGRRELAEELAQDIFVKCALAADTYQPSAKFTTWLFRIARNHCLNEMRRQDYRYHTEPMEESMVPSESQTPESQTAARRLHQTLEQGLAKLPATQREALVLSRFHSMSYEDIAQTMETTVSSVKSLINRAKKSMIKYLSRHLESCHEM